MHPATKVNDLHMSLVKLNAFSSEGRKDRARKGIAESDSGLPGKTAERTESTNVNACKGGGGACFLPHLDWDFTEKKQERHEKLKRGACPRAQVLDARALECASMSSKVLLLSRTSFLTRSLLRETATERFRTPPAKLSKKSKQTSRSFF